MIESDQTLLHREDEKDDRNGSISSYQIFK
jgi:hypothetical protein